MGLKLRKCFVLKEVEIDMDKLKKGDVFRLGKASQEDCVNEDQWSLAKTDSYPAKPDGNSGVDANHLEFVEVPTPRINFKY